MKRSREVLPFLLGGSAYVAGIGLTISSAWLITMASFQPPLQVLSIAIVGVRFFGISRSVARYTERLSSHKTVFDELSYLRTQLFDKITQNPLRLVRDLGSGAIVKKVVDDIERVQEYKLRITLPHVASLISVISGVLLGAWIQPESLVVTIPASVFLLLIFPKVIKWRCEFIARAIESYESDYSSLIQQASHGVMEAKLYGYLDERLNRTAEIENQIAIEEEKLASLTQRFQFSFICLVGISIISLAGLAQHLSPALPAVQVTILIFLPLVLFEAAVAWYPNLFAAGKMLLARADILSIESIVPVENFATSEVATRVKVIEVKGVQVRWNSDDHFMKPVSFSLSAGQSLAIRGRSGTGKSTLAMGLLGILDYDGEITLDGVELRTIANVSDHMVGAIQNSHIFNTSIRENMKIAAPLASDSEILSALEIVELDELVNQMPEGLDTVVGEFGRPLSGGEAKRLNLARAVLSTSEILVLDEPTEHLDDALSARIEEHVLSLDRTLIVITHSGWERCTQTFMLER